MLPISFLLAFSFDSTDLPETITESGKYTLTACSCLLALGLLAGQTTEPYPPAGRYYQIKCKAIKRKITLTDVPCQAIMPGRSRAKRVNFRFGYHICFPTKYSLFAIN